MIWKSEDELYKCNEDIFAIERKKQEDTIKYFIKKAGFKDNFFYEYSYTDNKITIYTTQPGIWIGLHKENIPLLREIFSMGIKEGCNIEIKEIHGYFMSVN